MDLNRCELSRTHPRLFPATPAAARSARGRRRPGRLAKGGLASELDAIRRAHPDARLSVWAEDERRLGLLPVARRVWAPVGHRPLARVHRRYRWLYVHGFVRPTTGQSWWALLPTVRAEAFGAALGEFARGERLDATRRAVLVLDNAGWHRAKPLAVPEGIDLVFLPAYAPELQPAGRLWPLIDEPVANRAFGDLAELETVLAARCQTLRATPAAIRAHTHFHWWPDEPALSDH